MHNGVLEDRGVLTSECGSRKVTYSTSGHVSYQGSEKSCSKDVGVAPLPGFFNPDAWECADGPMVKGKDRTH